LSIKNKNQKTHKTQIMSIPAFRTYALTVRPRDGVTDDHVSRISKWVRKNAEYYHLVTEKTGSRRHVHCGVVLKESRTRSNVLQRILNLFKELTATEKSVLRNGLKIMYNWDFVNHYLDKDDETVVIESHLPESGHIESFFPPKPVEKVSKKCSLYYHELETLWFKHVSPGTEVHTKNARDFLFKMMYSERCIPVIRDDKQIIQTARHLVRWLNKTEESTIELPVFEKEE